MGAPVRSTTDESPKNPDVVVDREAAEHEELIAAGRLQRVHVGADRLRGRDEAVVVELVDAAHQRGLRVVGVSDADSQVAVVLGEREQVPEPGRSTSALSSAVVVGRKLAKGFTPVRAWASLRTSAHLDFQNGPFRSVRIELVAHVPCGDVGQTGASSTSIAVGRTMGRPTRVGRRTRLSSSRRSR